MGGIAGVLMACLHHVGYLVREEHFFPKAVFHLSSRQKSPPKSVRMMKLTETFYKANINLSRVVEILEKTLTLPQRMVPCTTTLLFFMAVSDFSSGR